MSDNAIRINVRGIPRDLWKRVRDYCWANDMTLGQFVIEALEERLNF